MGKEKCFWGSDVFKRTVMVINVCLIIGLVGHIIYMHASIRISPASSTPSVNSKEYTEDELSAMMDQANDSMMGIYANLLPGSRAEFSDGNVMKFMEDCAFSGYYDADHTAVSGYTYTVTSSDDEYLANVNIFSKKGSTYVQYKLMYDENCNLMLYYPADKAYISLKY